MNWKNFFISTVAVFLLVSPVFIIAIENNINYENPNMKYCDYMGFDWYVIKNPAPLFGSADYVCVNDSISRQEYNKNLEDHKKMFKALAIWRKEK